MAKEIQPSGQSQSGSSGGQLQDRWKFVIEEHLLKTVNDIVRFSRVTTNGVALHLAEAGPRDGPMVFLLHGFPEFWYGWRSQVPLLAERGFRIIAPDQRGYNLSDKPAGIRSYRLDELAADIIGLADHFGQKTFDIVGHDWGASVGWWLAGKYVSRIRRLAVLNAPHPAVWLEFMRNHPVPRRKSRYVRLLQTRRLPEFLARLSGFKALTKPFRDSIRSDAFTDEDLKIYREAWSQPGAITAMINWYRALFADPIARSLDYHIYCPTLVIWGKHDAYAEPDLAEASARLCTDARIHYFDQSTHWVQHDEPDRVSDLLANFLKD
jgi:pimeloyl-ACP methyl ester carboxylesterase